MAAKDEMKDPRPLAAFGTPRPVLPDDKIHRPQAAAVGSIQPDGSEFLLLIATDQNFLFSLSREQLARLHAAVGRTLGETAPDTQ